jgi:hypothetical protein
LRYAFMKLARELDARFESLLFTGRVSKWYSAIGNEAVAVPAGLALEPGDVLCTLHRDVGAVLASYLDPARAFPMVGAGAPDGRRPAPETMLYRLACPLRLLRAAGGDPPRRHDQPPRGDDPGRRRLRFHAEEARHRPDRRQLHR